MTYSGRSLHWQHEEMKKMHKITQSRNWLQQDVVQATLKELVWSLALGGMIAGAIVGLFL